MFRVGQKQGKFPCISTHTAGRRHSCTRPTVGVGHGRKLRSQPDRERIVHRGGVADEESFARIDPWFRSFAWELRSHGATSRCHNATSLRVSTACRKERRSLMTWANEAGATSRRSRARKARHWDSLSRAKLSSRPIGTCCGKGVRRRSKVRRMASATSSPSNANVCVIVQGSWKSFLRVFPIPSEMIASVLSATTVSGGYARRMGAGASRRAGTLDAVEAVRESARTALEGKDPGEIAARDLTARYRAPFARSVVAGILNSAQLAARLRVDHRSSILRNRCHRPSPASWRNAT